MMHGVRIKPKYLVLMAVTMAVIMFGTAAIEIQQSNKHTLMLLTEEALSLIETVDRSAETTMLSNIALETLIDIMLLGHWIEMKSVSGASRALEELARLLPSYAHRFQPEGSLEEIPLDHVQSGDLLLVRPGE